MSANPVGFQPGNQHAVRVKLIDRMIRSCLAQDEDDVSAKSRERTRLRQAIDKCLDFAADGSLPHLDWITCRLEGKPAQAVTVEDADGLPAFKAIRLIVVSEAQAERIVQDVPQALENVKVSDDDTRLT